MKELWNQIKLHTAATHAHRAFLITWTAIWTIGSLIVGLLFCGVTVGSTFVENLQNVLCIAAYAGIIFGLFGGMFFLMRQDA